MQAGRLELARRLTTNHAAAIVVGTVIGSAIFLVPNDMVIGEVVYFHFRPDLVDARQRVDAARLNAVGRLAGYDGYVRTTDRITMPRLPVPPGKPSA